METVEPQRPDGGSLLRPTSTDVAEPILQHAGSAQILDCYRNGHGRASGARFGSACPNRRRLPWALWQCRHQRVQTGNTTCGLRPDMGLLFSDLPQQTLPNLFYNMRTPPRYWIATAMDIVEPQRPDSGRHVESKTIAVGALELWSSTSPGREKIIQYINRNMHKLNHNQILAVSR